MSGELQARSISRAVAERLPARPAAGEVMAVFERACLLVASGSVEPPDREPLALVVPDIGDGPLNVVVEAQAAVFAGLEPGAPATLARDAVCAGGLSVNLAAARTWEPRPDWETLRVAWPRAQQRLDLLRSAACTAAPAGSLLALLEGGSSGWPPGREEALRTARRAAWALAAGWAGDGQALVRGARHLAGLGRGLTPAGDDFLAGFMLRAWLAHPWPGELCHDVAMAAAPRTTRLAAAFLRAAARGECSAPWHALLQAVTTPEGQAWIEALHRILAYGDTSGADTLAGFLWQARDCIMSKE